MRSATRQALGLLTLLTALFFASPLRAHADVGLIIEGPTEVAGFFSDLGHAAIWISRACVDPHGDLYFCENSAGAVLSGSGYWLKTGAAAIPATDYFLGPHDRPEKDEKVVEAEWTETLGATYPNVPANLGAKFIGRVWGRQLRVQVFPTTPEQDKLAIARIAAIRDRYRFRTLNDNCANFSLQVLRVWLGNGLTVRHWSDAHVLTPVAVEHGLLDALGRAPTGEVVTYRFPIPRAIMQSRPPLDVCSALLFDPKYAVSVLFADPFAYLGAGYCYGYTHWRDHERHAPRQHAAHPALRYSKGAEELDPRAHLRCDDRRECVTRASSHRGVPVAVGSLARAACCSHFP